MNNPVFVDRTPPFELVPIDRLPDGWRRMVSEAPNSLSTIAKVGLSSVMHGLGWPEYNPPLNAYSSPLYRDRGDRRFSVPNAALPGFSKEDSSERMQWFNAGAVSLIAVRAVSALMRNTARTQRFTEGAFVEWCLPVPDGLEEVCFRRATGERRKSSLDLFSVLLDRYPQDTSEIRIRARFPDEREFRVASCAIKQAGRNSWTIETGLDHARIGGRTSLIWPVGYQEIMKMSQALEVAAYTGGQQKN